LSGLAKNTEIKVSGVLDSVETILNPERFRDVTSERLSHYVAKQRKAGLAESTISSYVASLSAALGYAVEWGYLAKLPELPRQQRAKASKMMKGRPITGEEFDRMLASTTPVVGPDVAASWKRLLRGLYLSGLRLSESLTMSWDEVPGVIVVDLSGRRPMFRVPAEGEKGNRDRILPMAPRVRGLLGSNPGRGPSRARLSAHLPSQGTRGCDGNATRLGRRQHDRQASWRCRERRHGQDCERSRPAPRLRPTMGSSRHAGDLATANAACRHHNNAQVLRRLGRTSDGRCPMGCRQRFGYQSRYHCRQK
jgi:integrase